MDQLLQPSDFPCFFQEVFGHPPYPWQTCLAMRVAGGDGNSCDWPQCIALPTAAGKTACLDIAVFALACQASRAPHDRTAARRIFMVVDRRIIVDQGFEHALGLAGQLTNPPIGSVLERVSHCLRRVGADACRPLDVYCLRGGMYRESAWVRSPLQPTVVISTVDQIGSRLLFRGYGVRDGSIPIHAALMANDALILLDEAHCSRPFHQTMDRLRGYRAWASQALPLPFQFAAMSGTPSRDYPAAEVLTLSDADRSPDCLGPRIHAPKPTRLKEITQANGTRGGEAMVRHLADEVADLLANGRQRVGVIVNRVAMARNLSNDLRRRLAEADTVLITGRMRPVDRDAVSRRLAPFLPAASPRLQRPIVVVATQCIEVGADLDFDALVSECASLDAIRQRFGRLNRAGTHQYAADDLVAVIAIRGDQSALASSPDKRDPVYGDALPRTWQWLKKNLADTAAGDRLDMSIENIERLWEATPPEDRPGLLAPAPDAAVLLPAHLDALCQTSPRSTPEPPVAPFLHGQAPTAYDVQVVFRDDLGSDPGLWPDIVALCPPSSAEALPVRLRDFKAWVRGQTISDPDLSDVEGAAEIAMDDELNTPANPHSALRWFGAESARTEVICAPEDTVPGDTYVVPTQAAADLADLPIPESANPELATIDCGDEAYQRARDRALIRSWVHLPQLQALTPDAEELDQQIDSALDQVARDPSQPEWLVRAAQNLVGARNRKVEPHPIAGHGFALVGKRRLRQFDPTFLESDDSWEGSSLDPYPLERHCADVGRLAQAWAVETGLTAFSTTLHRAGLWHDAGKADPRFQAWMHGGSQRRANLSGCVAKSMVPMPTRADRRRARELAGYPQGGRHELASARIAGAALPPNDADADLLLHLIAAHHGGCRPFGQIATDPNPQPYSYNDGTASHDFVPVAGAISGHGWERLESGVPQRFWALIRRYGWWGLPYLEAILRLADWHCPDLGASEGLDTSEAHAHRD